MPLRPLLPLIALLGAAACESVPAADPTESDIRFIASDALEQSGFPLSMAVEADGWVFLSGALGTVPGAGLVPGLRSSVSRGASSLPLRLDNPAPLAPSATTA